MKRILALTFVVGSMVSIQAAAPTAGGGAAPSTPPRTFLTDTASDLRVDQLCCQEAQHKARSKDSLLKTDAADMSMLLADLNIRLGMEPLSALILLDKNIRNYDLEAGTTQLKELIRLALGTYSAIYAGGYEYEVRCLMDEVLSYIGQHANPYLIAKSYTAGDFPESCLPRPA